MEYFDYQFTDKFVSAFDEVEVEVTPVYGWNFNFTPGDKVEFAGLKGKVVEMTTEYEWQVPVVFNRTGGDSGYITLVHSENLNKR